MSNDFVKQMREFGDDPQDVSLGEWAEWSHKWADHIKKLEAEIADLKASLAKAVGHLEKLDRLTASDAALVQAALAELKGGSDD